MSVADWDDTALRARVTALEASITELRHDLRGILSPAMLVADRLLMNADPSVKRAGEVMVRCVEQAAKRLDQTKGG
jgi:hypothetical protein